MASKRDHSTASSRDCAQLKRCFFQDSASMARVAGKSANSMTASLYLPKSTQLRSFWSCSLASGTFRDSDCGYVSIEIERHYQLRLTLPVSRPSRLTSSPSRRIVAMPATGSLDCRSGSVIVVEGSASWSRSYAASAASSSSRCWSTAEVWLLEPGAVEKAEVEEADVDDR